MIDSTNVRVLADNISKLWDKIKSISGDLLPSRSTATTGQILKLTGENKTPAWSDEYSYTPPAYSETETATGQKWIDNKDVYCRVFSSNTPGTASAGTYNLVDLEENHVINCFGFIMLSDVKVFFNTATGAGNIFLQQKATGEIAFTTNSASSFSNKPFVLIVYYTKPDPVPSDAKGPEDSDQEIQGDLFTPDQGLNKIVNGHVVHDEEPEEKKTTKKRSSK